VLVLIPAGEFRMGSPADEAGRGEDERQHRRVIRQPFYFGRRASSYCKACAKELYWSDAERE
jgi:hypothetical protein